MYKIKRFDSILYKLTALRNFSQSILNYKLIRPVSILRLPKVQKNRLAQRITNNAKTQISAAIKIISYYLNNVFLIHFPFLLI